MEGIIYFRQHSTVCFQTLEGKEILVDRLNDREEKISDALYIQLKDILAILWKLILSILHNKASV